MTTELLRAIGILMVCGVLVWHDRRLTRIERHSGLRRQPRHTTTGDKQP
ncbi:hypothetical protein [Streptomyces sp. NBC_01304]|nr:hypothetical protein OG430_44920 [Streptomyces sp. NBC_01304]